MKRDRGMISLPQHKFRLVGLGVWVSMVQISNSFRPHATKKTSISSSSINPSIHPMPRARALVHPPLFCEHRSQLREDSRDRTPHLHQRTLIPDPSLDAPPPILHPHPALLPPAHAHLRRTLAPGIDPRDARLEPRHHAVRQAEVFPEHARRQAQVRRVRAPHRLVHVVVGQDAHHRPEDFFPHDLHVVPTVGEHGRLEPISLLVGPWQRDRPVQTARQDRRAVDLDSVPDVGAHLVKMRLADQRPEIRRRVHHVPRPDAPRSQFVQEYLLELPLPRRGDKNPRPVRAHLARAEEVGHHGAVRGLRQVRVRQHEARALPAQFHGDVLHPRRRGRRDFPARRDLARETHLGHVPVRREVAAHLRAAEDDVEHAVGDARFGVDLREGEGVQGRDLARLVDHAVPRGEARAGLPQRDLQRVVPGADADTHAQGLFGAVHPRVRAEAGGLAVQAARGDEVGEELEDVGAGDDIDGGCLGEGFAGVEGFGFGEGVVASAQERGGFEEDGGALRGGGLRPRGEGGFGGDDGGVDVGGGCAVDCGEGCGGGGIDGLEGRPRGGLDAAGVVGVEVGE